MSHTILASTMGSLWRTLITTGFDPTPLFRKLGVDPEVINNPYARLPQKTVNDLWRRAIEVTGDDCLGIKAGCHWHPSQFGALGYAWLASSTLRTALNRIARNLWLLNDIQEVRLEETPVGFVYSLLSKAARDKMSSHDDACLAILIEMCRSNYGEQLNPVAVTFTRPKPNCSEEHSAHFRCPVEFGAGQNSLTLPMQAIDRPLQGDNPTLARLSDQAIIKHQIYMEQTQFTERVKALIIDQLASGNIKLQKIADLLLVTPRTLQRRLKSEGKSFSGLVEETRRELADKYIRENSFNLKEISFLLGFSEESAFSRAFKRWTGQSPSDYPMRKR